MKKKVTFLLSFCLLATMLVTLAVPAFAAEKVDITQTYFSSGKLTKPEVPYLYVEDSYVNLFLEQIPELMKIAEDYQSFEKKNPDSSDNYFDANGAYFFCKTAQIDYKFDDNAWASENGDWNAVDGRNFNTGSNDYNGICFAVSNAHDSSLAEYDNSKMGHIRQADLGYYDPEDSMYSYLHPYVKKVGDDYRLNLDDHTFTVRLRWYVTYEENETKKSFFSDWSDETSIGKDGTQEEATLPTLESPTLSDFSLVTNENGSVGVKYYIDIHDTAYKANRYHFIHDNYYDSYVLEAQIKKGNGEWTDVNTSNASWLINGYRTCGETGDLDIRIGDDVWMRVRIVCGSFDEEPSPWSNIIGTKALDGVDDTTNPGTISGDPTDSGTTEKAKCKVCGICPIQPLGICLFIWIAIILVIVLVIVIVVVVANKKKDKKKQQ